MYTTNEAKFFMTADQAMLDDIAKHTSDTVLETVSIHANRILAGGQMKVSNHTPRGRVISKEQAKLVLRVVRAEQSKRCGI